MSDRQSEKRDATRRTLAAVIVVLTCLGVFWLPWLFPTVVRPVVSDSQVAGFTNRVAELAFGLGAVALFLIAWVGRATTPPFVQPSADAEEPRISRWVVYAAMAAGVAVVAVLGFLYRDRPFLEAEYFIDRTLYLVNGSRPYIDFEFSYGPLLLYPQYILWLLLRPLGVSVSTAYYICMGIARLVGLALAAYVIDRLTLSRGLKNALFVWIAVFEVCQLGMGLEYSFLRFVAYLSLLLGVLAFAKRSTNRVAVAGAAAGAVVLCLGISPEIGVALLVGMLAAFSFRVLRGEHGDWLSLVALGVVALGAGWLIAGNRTFVGLAGGAYYFPVLPGPPVLLYLGSVLLLAWCVGANLRSEVGTASVLVGWLAATIVLGAAALGRADFGHVYWNGLGAFLAAPAILYTRRRALSWAAVVATASTFLAMLVAYSALALLPSMDTTRSQRLPDPTPQQLATIVGLESVAAPWQLYGSVGTVLAERHELMPTYQSAMGAISSADLQQVQTTTSAARYLLLQTAEYDALASIAKNPPATTGPFVGARSAVGDRRMTAMLLGWPFVIPGRYPDFNASVDFALYMVREWTPVKTVDGYTILTRRPAK